MVKIEGLVWYTLIIYLLLKGLFQTPLLINQWEKDIYHPTFLHQIPPLLLPDGCIVAELLCVLGWFILNKIEVIYHEFIYNKYIYIYIYSIIYIYLFIYLFTTLC